MNTQNGYEYWHDGIKQWRRCSCWRHLLRPIQTVSGLGWIADGNGWVEGEKPYPHAKNCPHRNR